MSIDVGSGRQDTSGFGKSIRKFSSIRDSFDKVVKILELLQAADLLYEDDREFLDTKLDDLKVRAEEIRIENLKKPKYTPPPTKLSSDIADNLGRSYGAALDDSQDELRKGIESMYHSSPGLTAALESVLSELDSVSSHVADARIDANDEMCLHAEGLNPLYEVKTAEPAISSSHDFLGDHWWYDLKPGDIVYCVDEQHNYHTLSVMRNDRDEMRLIDHYGGIYFLWSAGDIMSYLAPNREMLKNKHPVDMRFL